MVLTPLPQADGQVKNRPCIALRRLPGFRDWLVCGVTSQLHQEVPGFDDLLLPDHEDCLSTGLKAPSLIRLGFLAVVPEGRLLGTIGSVSPARHRGLLRRLSSYLVEAAG